MTRLPRETHTDGRALPGRTTRRVMMMGTAGLALFCTSPAAAALPQNPEFSPPLAFFRGVRLLDIRAQAAFWVGNRWSGLDPSLSDDALHPRIRSTALATLSQLREDPERALQNTPVPVVLGPGVPSTPVSASDMDDALALTLDIRVRDVTGGLTFRPPQQFAVLAMLQMVRARRPTVSGSEWTSQQVVDVRSVLRTRASGFVSAYVAEMTSDALQNWYG